MVLVIEVMTIVVMIPTMRMSAGKGYTRYNTTPNSMDVIDLDQL